MVNGYKVLWTEHALSELSGIIEYLEENWTERELRKFSHALDHIVELISKNPLLFQDSTLKKNIRRAVISKHTNLYYRLNSDSVEILSVFSNRQNPEKLKLKD